MSAQPDDGGPAAPCMTLRDWLAGQETLSDYDHPADAESWGQANAVPFADTPEMVADILPERR